MKRYFSLIVIALFQSTCAFSLAPPTSDYFSGSNALGLAEAAESGDSPKIAKLIAGGADVNVTGRFGMTPLIWALLNRNREGFDYLLEHGANPNAQLTSSMEGSLGEVATKGCSAISLSAMYKEDWYLKDVLKHGGDPSLVNSFQSDTPISSAMHSLRTKNAKLLIAAGANPNWQNRDGVTPLMDAAMLNNFDLVYLMLKAGADPTIQANWGSWGPGVTLVYFIKKSVGHTLPEGTMWREKVVQLLQDKGIDTTAGR